MSFISCSYFEVISHLTFPYEIPYYLYYFLLFKNHPNAWPFMEPVKRTEAPGYYEVIRFPMDLKTMSERLRNRYYVSKKLFMADLQRVFTNCKEYNPPESEYYKCASILEKFFFSKIKEAGLIDK